MIAVLHLCPLCSVQRAKLNEQSTITYEHLTGNRSRARGLKLKLSNMLLHKIISRVWDRYGLQLLNTHLKKANMYISKCITKHINIRM